MPSQSPHPKIILKGENVGSYILRRLSSPATKGNQSSAFLDNNNNKGFLEQKIASAAVLIPLVGHLGGATVLFTQRANTLLYHPGQISFPGGRIDPEDSDAKGAALREIYEEIGIGANYIEVVGTLEDYRTGTGFIITPVVGFVHTGFNLQLSSSEVKQVFEIPLEFVLDPTNYYLENMEISGIARTFWVLNWKEYRIWGATAALLVDLARRLIS